MDKIYSPITIEKWVEIATKIQKLNFNNTDFENFQENLRQLNRILTYLDIDINPMYQCQYPEFSEQINSVALLNSIYHDFSISSARKAHFFEIIMTLKYLGVKTITFNPCDFLENVYNINRTNNNETVLINKLYTDGNFYVKNLFTDHPSFEKIKNANYIMKICLEKNKSGILISKDINVAIKKFKTNVTQFPSKEEIEKTNIPYIRIYDSSSNDKSSYGSPRYIFDFEKIEQKRKVLTLQKKFENGEYHY